ncbi:MAG: hypothetical protein K6E85_16990 [Lachnospiraceae bacterium]|nr:hypothetical protein [Lachnospiraceae bacterium]
MNILLDNQEVFSELQKSDDGKKLLNTLIQKSLEEGCEEIGKLIQEEENLKGTIKQLNDEIKEKKEKESIPTNATRLLVVLICLERDMFWCIRRKSLQNTEKYYNWLLPEIDKIDRFIPFFSISWKSNRRNYNGMRGLVRGATEAISFSTAFEYKKIEINVEDSALGPATTNIQKKDCLIIKFFKWLGNFRNYHLIKKQAKKNNLPVTINKKNSEESNDTNGTSDEGSVTH